MKPLSRLLSALGLAAAALAPAVELALNLEYPVTAAMGSAVMVVPALIGMQAGQWLRQRLSLARFKLCFMAALVLLDAWMVWRAL